MSWIYHQTSGKLGHVGHHVANGYSGHGKGLNNPQEEMTASVGPIPRGRWRIGLAYNSETLGPHVMNLDPVAHSAHGRTSFRIHGDNRRVDHSASHGCIILPRMIRERISHSGDKTLVVVE